MRRLALFIVSVLAIASMGCAALQHNQVHAERPPVAATAVPLDTLSNTANATSVRVQAVRNNRGEPWFARDGTALWTRTSSGLALVDLDGRTLERIPGTNDIRETPDGVVRAYPVSRVYPPGNDWLVVSPSGTRRILGVLSFPSLSPDGRYFAFELPVANRREVHVIDLQNGQEIEVAIGLGRCHCDTLADYGFPEWASDTTFTYTDHGDFIAPPEEHPGDRFVFDVAARRGAFAPALAPSPRCGGSAVLHAPDGVHELRYVPLCTYSGP
jgi:hypothetical protein